MENCEHILHFPKPPLDGKNHCGFYSKHTIKGRHWAHYPECKEENCPHAIVLYIEYEKGDT